MTGGKVADRHRDRAPDRLAAHLLSELDAERVVTVTWLNHASAQICLNQYASDLGKIDLVGVDGILLQKMLSAPSRTSADLVVPRIFAARQGLNVAIIGGTPEGLTEAVEAVKHMIGPHSRVCLALDGYGGSGTPDELASRLHETRPDVVLIGMGAGRQEALALATKANLEAGIVLTCGGFIDQLKKGGYYPRWAYPLKLNWLVRLAREPRRLWRRYTIMAFAAVRERDHLASQVQALDGFRSMITLEVVPPK